MNEPFDTIIERKQKAADMQSRVDRLLAAYQCVENSDSINADEVNVTFYDCGEAELRLVFE